MLEKLGPQLLQRIKQTNVDIAEAEGLIQLLRDAGEDASNLESSLASAVLRRDRWVSALAARGIEAKEGG